MIMTATFQMARDLGWDYFEQLAKQKIMQVQSSTDPPKKLALGERAVMADGNEYNMFQLKEAKGAGRDRLSGRRHPAGGRANAIFKNAPNPECRAAVPELLLHARKRSSSSSTSAACAPCIRWRRRRPGARRSRDQAHEG